MQMVKNAERIIEEAEKWIGTPYKKRHRTFGMGVDCAGLVYMVGKLAGADIKDLPNYDDEPTRGQLKKQLHDKLDQIPHLQAGCILEMKIHTSPQHLGIATDRGTFIHANMSPNAHLNKVIEQRMDDALLRRVSGFWVYRWQS